MGRDNSPKVRQREQLKRKQSQRRSHDRILIVTEGSKTEPNYFNGIRVAYRLSSANVVTVSSKQVGTAPIQIVQYAKELFQDGDVHLRIQARAFEQVFAVFDRDDHDSYFDALRQAKLLDGKLKNDLKRSVRFQSIASVPCFELWLLLHYEEIHAPLHRDVVMRQLRKHLPDYDKGMRGVFTKTRDKLDVAMQRAEALAARFTAHDGSEPFTAVVDLVKLLTSLRSRS